MKIPPPKLFKFYFNLSLDFLHLLFPRFSPGLTINPNSLSALKKLQEQGGLILTFHYSQYELLGQAILRNGLRFKAVTQTLQNPWAEQLLSGIRKKRGDYEFADKYSFKEVYSFFKQNQSILVFLQDQDPVSPTHPTRVFFHAPARFSKIPQLLSRTDKPFFCGWVERSNFRYFVQIREISPDDWISNSQSILEQAIIRNTEQWYGFSHRRFKSTAAPIYTQTPDY